MDDGSTEGGSTRENCYGIAIGMAILTKEDLVSPTAPPLVNLSRTTTKLGQKT